MTGTSFTERLQNSQGDMVYLVHGKDSGKDAWHYVLIEKMKLPLFKHALATGTVDAAQYGKLLHSGWGKEPPQEITDAVKKQFSGEQ